MSGFGEIAKHLTPGGIISRASPVTFVHHDEIEEVGGELAINLLPFLLACHGLIERQIDFVVLLNLAIGNLVHHLAEGGKVPVAWSGPPEYYGLLKRVCAFWIWLSIAAR